MAWRGEEPHRTSTAGRSRAADAREHTFACMTGQAQSCLMAQWPWLRFLLATAGLRALQFSRVRAPPATACCPSCPSAGHCPAAASRRGRRPSAAVSLRPNGVAMAVRPRWPAPPSPAPPRRLGTHLVAAQAPVLLVVEAVVELLVLA